MLQDFFQHKATMCGNRVEQHQILMHGPPMQDQSTVTSLKNYSTPYNHSLEIPNAGLLFAKPFQKWLLLLTAVLL